MAPAAGKTAPRLLQDLLSYDLRYEDRAGRNLLTTAPPHHDPSAPPAPAVPYRNCRHKLKSKPEQSQPPRPGEDPDHTTVYKIASFCDQCRYHFDLLVDFRDNGSKNTPCNPSYMMQPLHHFLHQPEDGDDIHEGFNSSSATRSYRFSCSMTKCPVELRIRISPPRITDHDITILTNPSNLRRRWEVSKELGGDRSDSTMARPVDAPDYLNTYLADSLNPSKGKSRIPFMNRKFLKTFGRDCDELLKRVGFTEAEEEEEDGSRVRVWYLPKPPPAGHPLEDSERNKIEDFRHELGRVIIRFPENERTGIRHTPVPPQSALHEIERALGCLNYEKVSGRVETRDSNHEEDHPYYAGLGAVGDFSDRLLLFSFNQQMRVDPANSPYYFECLQDLAVGRRSSDLQTQVAMFASNGYVNRKELSTAYRFFGIDPKHASSLNDDHIIGSFKSRLPDISPLMAVDARKHLKLIGVARNSDRIKQEASDAIQSYEQALSWLDLDAGQPDDFVTTMYTLKIQDNASTIETARKAVSIIAEHRGSQRLRDFLLNGSMDDAEMDAGEAYALLGLSDRTVQIDIEILRFQVGAEQESKPESTAKYQQAFEVVCRDQKERFGNASGIQPRSARKYPLDTWPVGFQNIGNTCYLNSVLQFLFTIKPLRDMVLECDKHMQDVTAEALESKRVGRSSVTAEKVEKAQRFVRELQKLFEHMITASTDAVRPERDLAALALTKESTVGRKPVENNAGHSGLGELEGQPILGPSLPPKAGEFKTDSPADSVMGDGDAAHSNAAAADDDAKSNTSMTAMDLSNSVDELNPVADSRPEPPSRPPPVPPRPQTQAQTEPSLKDIEFSAEQQDAAEIMNNIFDLLSCAFKGDDVMEDGEQLDLIKQLFFSDITTVREAKGKRVEKSDIQDNIHISTKARDRPLWAALDDEFTLDQLDDGSTKFEFIANASPIQIINVRRLQFEGGKSVKDQSHVGLDKVLYLDRYLKETKSLSAKQLEERRNRQWELQKKLQELEAHRRSLSETETKNLDLAGTVDSAVEFLEDISKEVGEEHHDLGGDTQLDPQEPDSSNLCETMRNRAKGIRKQIEDLDAPMKQVEEEINSVFADCKDHPYRIHAVFMHRGGAAGGHYWIFIYDFKQNIWRKYNDEQVDEVDEAEVFKHDTAPNPATSTGIIFIRDNMVQDLTESVYRIPSDTDVPMQDVEEEMPPLASMDAEIPRYKDVQVINGVEKE
ncbi:ubiquitin C-terminal hydrolase-like protein [Corynespora cassiicola Philippines]|uniref:ubiquitinyl hydrolase 1 n=1 Tax=Corynespora cassiicola Philippines TaxID=1448308 RepID=A0A2T2NAT0_CORCC|nr:ubiquitin C-terminal hydrolase-like protein [Corynespora cassiicola Philippines]